LFDKANLWAFYGQVNVRTYNIHGSGRAESEFRLDKRHLNSSKTLVDVVKYVCRRAKTRAIEHEDAEALASRTQVTTISSKLGETGLKSVKQLRKLHTRYYCDLQNEQMELALNHTIIENGKHRIVKQGF
jgi:hypothetical protein